MTRTEAQTHLDAWLAADTATAGGKSYTIGNRALTRADAEEISRQITYWRRVWLTMDANDKGNKNPGVRVAAWN